MERVWPKSRRVTALVRVLALAAAGIVVVGCPSGPGSGSPPAAAGDIHLHISKAFDNRATEADMWNSGTVAADGVFSTAKLDTMDQGVIYDGNQIGPTPWKASTDQQSGDYEGECNGSSDCRPCTGTYGGTWDIPSVDFTVEERGNGRYVIELWLGNDLPPRTGGCEPMVAGPVTWSDNITVTLTGANTATPTGTAVASQGSDQTYTVAVSK